MTRRETNILKGIGILTVILSHTSIMCKEAFGSLPLLRNETACMALCEAGMSLFLFISGYGLHKSYTDKGLKGYIKGKLVNVLIPYMAIQALSMLISAIRNGIHGSILFNLTQLIGINSTNLYDPTMWYISYIIFWYGDFWLAYKIGSGSYLSLVIIGLVSAAGFVFVPWYWGNNADYCIMTFFLGVLAGFIEDKRVKSDRGEIKMNPFVTAAICVILTISGYTLMIGFHRLNIFTENAGAFMGMATFVLFVRILRDKYDFPVLNFIGTISFMLYLLEWKLIICSGVYNIWGCNYLSYAVCFAATLIIAHLLTKGYKRLKAYF